MCPNNWFLLEEERVALKNYNLHEQWEEIEERLLIERRNVCEALLSAVSLPSDFRFARDEVTNVVAAEL